jgi:hypothetical protein
VPVVTISPGREGRTDEVGRELRDEMPQGENRPVQDVGGAAEIDQRSVCEKDRFRSWRVRAAILRARLDRMTSGFVCSQHVF